MFLSVLDCTTFTEAIDQRLVFMVGITLLSFCAVTVLMLLATGHLMHSVNDVCRTMQTVSQGDLGAADQMKHYSL